MSHEHGTRKATREKRARAEQEVPQEVAHVLTPVTPTSPPAAQRALLFATPQTEAEQTPASTPKMLKSLATSLFTPTGETASPWKQIISPGLDEFLGRGALRQPVFGNYSPLPHSPGIFFTSPTRAEAESDACATASETLLGYIQEALISAEIDTAQMLRTVTSAHTSVSEALKTLPESSAKLAELYQEFIGKLTSFIGLINNRQKQAEALTSDDLGFFLNTLSTPSQSIKVSNH